MALRNLFRRHRRPTEAPAQPGSGRQDWPDLPPLQRAVEAPSLVTAPTRFASGLVAWQDPSLRTVIGHAVSAEAPSGTGEGLAEAAAAAPRAEPLPQPREQRTWWPSRRPAVQRRVVAGEPAATPERGRPDEAPIAAPPSAAATPPPPVRVKPVRAPATEPLTSARAAELEPLRLALPAIQRRADSAGSAQEPFGGERRPSESTGTDRTPPESSGTDRTPPDAAGAERAAPKPAAEPQPVQSQPVQSLPAAPQRAEPPAVQRSIEPPPEPITPDAPAPPAPALRLGLGAPLPRGVDSGGRSGDRGDVGSQPPAAPAVQRTPEVPPPRPGRLAPVVQRSTTSPPPESPVAPLLPARPPLVQPPHTDPGPSSTTEATGASERATDRPAAPPVTPDPEPVVRPLTTPDPVPDPVVQRTPQAPPTPTVGLIWERAIETSVHHPAPPAEPTGLDDGTTEPAAPWRWAEPASPRVTDPPGTTSARPSRPAGPTLTVAAVQRQTSGAATPPAVPTTARTESQHRNPVLAHQPAPVHPEPDPVATAAPIATAAPDVPTVFMVQRVEASAPQPPAETATPSSESAGATAAGAGTAAGGSNSPTEVDALVRRLYDPIVRRIKAELRQDRERAGRALDLRH